MFNVQITAVKILKIAILSKNKITSIPIMKAITLVGLPDLP